jgi:hypothetical protein
VAQPSNTRSGKTGRPAPRRVTDLSPSRWRCSTSQQRSSGSAPVARLKVVSPIVALEMVENVLKQLAPSLARPADAYDRPRRGTGRKSPQTFGTPPTGSIFDARLKRAPPLVGWRVIETALGDPHERQGYDRPVRIGRLRLVDIRLSASGLLFALRLSQDRLTRSAGDEGFSRRGYP